VLGLTSIASTPAGGHWSTHRTNPVPNSDWPGIGPLRSDAQTGPSDRAWTEQRRVPIRGQCFGSHRFRASHRSCPSRVRQSQACRRAAQSRKQRHAQRLSPSAQIASIPQPQRIEGPRKVQARAARVRPPQSRSCPGSGRKASPAETAWGFEASLAGDALAGRSQGGAGRGMDRAEMTQHRPGPLVGP